MIHSYTFFYYFRMTTHSLSLAHSLTHSLTHSFTHAHIHTHAHE